MKYITGMVLILIMVVGYGLIIESKKTKSVEYSHPSCGINSDKYPFLIKMPIRFKEINKSNETGYSYYSYQNNNDVFEVSCGSGGVGAEGCGKKNQELEHDFKYNGKKIIGCLEKSDDRLILRLTSIESPTDYQNRIYFSANLMNNSQNVMMIDEILSSFSFIGQ